MATRGFYWLATLALLGGLVSLVLLGVSPYIVPVLVLLMLCILGALAQILRLLEKTPAGHPRLAPPSATPADGVVEFAPVAASRGQPNARDGRLRRFLGLEPLAPGSEVAIPVGTPALLGRVAILSFFIGRDGREWSDEEITQVYRSLQRAGVWIEREAIRWEAPVNIQLADTYLAAEDDLREESIAIAVVPEGDHQALFEADSGTRSIALFSRCAAQLGFADAADLIARVGQRIEADGWVWLLHVRSAGRSLAVPECDTPWPGVTLAVCYAQEANLPEPLIGAPYADSVTFVHELLHLFGATDKYTVALSTYSPRLVTHRDVMCLNFDRLSQLRVDELTAAEIGWTTTPRA
jgi:hypothetical protein